MKTRLIISATLLVFSAAVAAEGGNLWEKILDEKHAQLSPSTNQHASDLGMTAVEHKRYHFNDANAFINENPPSTGHGIPGHHGDQDETKLPNHASEYKRRIFGPN
jgi:hypothetical protein